MAVVEDTLEEGEEVRVEDYQRWAALTPRVGMVLEVNLGATSLPIDSDTRGAFLIVGVASEGDGSHLLTGRLLGCEDADIGAALAGDQCAGEVSLHLYLSRPCVPLTKMTTEVHVTHIRLWTWHGFKDTGYLPPDAGERVKGMLKDERGRKPKAAPKNKPDKPEKGEKSRARTPRTPKPKPGADSGLTSEMKENLRAKLSTVRAKLKPGSKREVVPAVEEVEKKKKIDDDGWEEISEDYTPSPAPLVTGATLETPRDVATSSYWGPFRSDGKAEGYKRHYLEESEWPVDLEGYAKDKGEKGSSEKEESQKGQGDVRGETACEDPYLERGVREEGLEKEEATNGGWSDSELQWELFRHFGQWRGGAVRQRSRSPSTKEKQGQTRIGIGHAHRPYRLQMDQMAMTDMSSSSRQLTGGVKVASYFQMQIKGQFPQYQRELREMHSLAATLDLLRIGDVGRVGDSLAARFMAIHQFMIDANWNTARYMELHSMEDSNAATPAVVLASRKHSRLVDRVQGRGWNGAGYGYYNRGKGRGKNEWKGYGDGYQDHKGEKGKHKGKGKKGKGKGGDGKWDNKVKEWDGARATVDEK